MPYYFVRITDTIDKVAEAIVDNYEYCAVQETGKETEKKHTHIILFSETTSSNLRKFLNKKGYKGNEQLSVKEISNTDEGDFNTHDFKMVSGYLVKDTDNKLPVHLTYHFPQLPTYWKDAYEYYKENHKDRQVKGKTQLKEIEEYAKKTRKDLKKFCRSTWLTVVLNFLKDNEKPVRAFQIEWQVNTLFLKYSEEGISKLHSSFMEKFKF